MRLHSKGKLMKTRLIKRELSVQSVIQGISHKERIKDMKAIALQLAKEYDGHIRIELNINPEHTNVKINVQEFDL